MPNRNLPHGTLVEMPVLVVDDQALAREVISEVLRPLGCRVRQAADGREALAEVNIHRYPLMFIDLMMPGMDGYELVRNIRRMEREQGLKPAIIVAFSGSLYAENGHLVPLEITRLQEQGFDDGLPKPVRMDMLQELIDHSFPEGAPDEGADEDEGQDESLPKAGAAMSGSWKVAASYHQPHPRAPFTRALVLDDDRFMQLTAQAQLERHIANVDIAGTPEEALQLFCRNPYHLLVLDLEMPEADGYAMAQKFRLLEAATPHRSCIVALSGHLAGPDILMKCAASGMDDCLAKPLDPVMLKTRLDMWQKGIYPALKLLKH